MMYKNSALIRSIIATSFLLNTVACGNSGANGMGKRAREEEHGFNDWKDARNQNQFNQLWDKRDKTDSAQDGKQYEHKIVYTAEKDELDQSKKRK